MRLSMEEKEQVEDRIRQIDSYLRNLPLIRERFVYQLNDKDYDVRFKATLGNDKTNYYVSVGYSSYIFDQTNEKGWIGNSCHAIKIITQWKEIKQSLLEHISKESSTLESLKNFTI